MNFDYLLTGGRTLTTGELRGKWTTSVSELSSLFYIIMTNTYFVSAHELCFTLYSELPTLYSYSQHNSPGTVVPSKKEEIQTTRVKNCLLSLMGIKVQLRK